MGCSIHVATACAGAGCIKTVLDPAAGKQKPATWQESPKQDAVQECSYRGKVQSAANKNAVQHTINQECGDSETVAAAQAARPATKIRNTQGRERVSIHIEHWCNQALLQVRMCQVCMGQRT
jgi:hypothetical protein